MLAIMFLFKEMYNALRTKAGRTFLYLLARYGNTERSKEIKVFFDGFSMQVPDPLSFIWQYKEIFVDKFYEFNSIETTPIIYDCGSNIGMSILYFYQLYPNARIVAFEANPDIAEILKQNIKKNNIPTVEIVPKAVWIDENGIMLGEENADSSSTFTENSKIHVPSTRLRNWVLRESRIDFLKIDIEGAEIEVLQDCQDSLMHVKCLFVEFHSYIGHSQNLASIVAIIQKNGFRYYIDTNQHRNAPFITHRYRNNNIMDLQLNIFAWRV